MQPTIHDFVPFILIPFIAWGVRHHLIQKKDWIPLKKLTFAVGISAYFVTEVARSFYRPYIYANEINDFHIADTIGNSAGTVTAIFMILTMVKSGSAKPHVLIIMVFFGLIGYEVISGSGSHPIDAWDIGATVVFTALSAILYYGVLARPASWSGQKNKNGVVT